MGVWVEGRETSFVIPRNKTEESVLGGREGGGGGGVVVLFSREQNRKRLERGSRS